MIVVRIQYKHWAQINSLPPVSSTGKILGPPDMTSRPLKDIVPVGKSSSSKSKSSASLLKVSKKPEDSRDDCMLAVDKTDRHRHAARQSIPWDKSGIQRLLGRFISDRRGLGVVRSRSTSDGFPSRIVIGNCRLLEYSGLFQ